MSDDSKTAAAPDDGTRTLTEPGSGLAATPPLSGSLDGARFVPGTLLAGRYRIVGLLGRGGMGEVYRAEDLKLGEPVALKFLPAELSLDGAALARFHREVRVARSIAHRNVCRVFDIGEAGGLHFLSMEYIDGEDLSALLERIGRLPSDKAVELARQICAGLEAAHEAGVLHRDMKPANVMVDGKGRAKITDFGLARVADELKDQAAFAGTPAYMAPEQIRSGAVSVQTDLYALGLVLYEMFTGGQAFAEGRRELLARGVQPEVSRPSVHVEGLDPAVEAVILRCLEEEASQRPASALQVSAALPGGNLLAAALAAGETPSPEMVAAAPEKGTLSPRVALACFVGLVALVLLRAPIAEKTRLISLVRPAKSPEILADRASTLAAELTDDATAGDRAYRQYGWSVRRGYLDHLRATTSALEGREALQRGRPTALTFWHRQSPRPLHRASGWTPDPRDPPLEVPGMTRVELDPAGRLVGWLAVPPLSAGSETAPSAPISWPRFFAAAGLDAEAFQPSEPSWQLGLPVDQRLAWEGSYPESRELSVRVEAGTFHGRAVYFEIAEPWDTPLGRGVASDLGTFASTFYRFIIPMWMVTLFAGVWLARRNLATGRADRRGAARLAAFAFATQILGWGLGAHHSGTANEFTSFQRALGQSLVWAVYFGVVYLALEPFLRRRWPEGLIGWNRLLAGRFRDPLVGHDVLLGSLLAALVAVLWEAGVWAVDQSGRPFEIGDDLWTGHLLGIRHSASVLLTTHTVVPIFNALALVFVFHLLLTLLRRKWLAAAGTGLILLASVLSPSNLLEVPICLLLAGLIVFPIARFGLLANLAFWFIFFMLSRFPMTTDMNLWFAGETIFAIGLTAGLGFWGFHTARAQQPLSG